MAIQIASLFATIGAKTDGLDKGLNQSKKSLEGFGSKVSSVAGTVAVLAAGAAAAGIAMKQIYDAAKGAAQLEYARTRFDNLSKSIGTTSDSLQDDLREATHGMISDAELVASAGDLMALGLAKTHDEVVRLTNVAGALGMNMNQLVLTLTNQTTMRFDALGVSVAGFDEKVKALEASGLSTQDAFTGAFLQQAEEQIETVGSASDSAVGSFARWEAATTNLKNQLAEGLLPAATAVVEVMTDIIDGSEGMATAQGNAALAVMEWASVRAEWDIMRYVMAGMNEEADEMGAHIVALNEQFGSGVFFSGSRTQAIVDYYIAMHQAGNETQTTAESEEDLAKAAIAAAEAQAKLKDELINLTTVGGNYQGIIDLAYEYTNMLEEKETLQIERQKLIDQGWSSQSNKVKELDKNIGDLDASMAEMADRVTLDMLQATIAVGGVTQAELAAYMQMAIDMGYMSEEGAKAAISAYGSAIETINGLDIDDKTGNVEIDAVSAFATLDLLEQYALSDKEQRVFIRTYYGTTPSNYDPYENYTGPANLPPKPGQSNRATGGGVIGGTPYIVGERGPELFVPNINGEIIPNHELSDYATGNVINNYNLTMPTTARAEDIRMAFELLEAWNR